MKRFEKIAENITKSFVARDASIGQIERGAKVFAKALERAGYQIDDIDVFRAGRGGQADHGTSYVEMEISKSFINDDGEEEQVYSSVKFMAGGYYGGKESRGTFSGGWTYMKKKALEYIEKDIEGQMR